MKALTCAAALAAALALLPGSALARGSHHSSGSHHSTGTHSSSHRSTGGSHSRHSTRSGSGSHHKAAGAPRDSHGRIKRSGKAKDDFKHSHPCPATGKSSGACPGYVIDHVKPLKSGGADDPSNMQWQTKEAAKAKDKWE